MSYRKKTVSAKELNPLQKLYKLNNANADGVPFQTHNALALLKQMKQYQRTIFDQFNKQTTVQGFYPFHAVGNAISENATLYTLPLPQYFIDPDTSPNDFEPRKFYHSSSITNLGKKGKSVVHLPRCGLTGLFFNREEVIDNLQAAASDLSFSSPFWIRRDHPGLRSGFLSVKDGSDAICISLTSEITTVENVKPFGVNLLHSSLRNDTEFSKPSISIPEGMNAITGFVSTNPYLQSLPRRGLWLSREQLLQHGIILKSAKDAISDDKAFTLVEIEQWELYNADQLTVPGRLGLRQSVPHDETVRSLFQKF
ncbi:unnamed protein product [Phytomonas sp. Hart1]|nr:unnamed protein product [Phytomonas sp. Hart1]|eukprot:CCW68800.1 unnamed protein product [Phytomonas sp. isolate Hart1]